jgi:hypothetical protein
MTALERISKLLHRSRMVGGWTDEAVAAAVLRELGLDDDGKPEAAEPSHTSSETGHG